MEKRKGEGKRKIKKKENIKTFMESYTENVFDDILDEFRFMANEEKKKLKMIFN